MDPAQITERRVKIALEALRKGGDLRPSELLELRAIQHRLAAEGRSSTEANRQWALGQLLAGLVRERLAAARGGALQAVALDRLPPEQEAARLAEDFAAGQPDREAWSCLYHRYTALRTWKVANIATIGQPGIAHATRQVNRRSQRGLTLLTQILREREQAAEAELPDARPAASEAPRHNLPHRRSSFVGRGAAVAELRRLVLTSGFVTLTGPGGVGKTRLAEVVAEGLVDHHPDGVWWIELSEIAEEAALAPAIARVLAIPEQPGRPMEEQLVEALTGRRMLLILDNCEHRIEACRALAGMLLPRCRGLALLATSREPLHLAGERIWEVPALALPPTEIAPSPEALADFEAVRLFVERAEAANRGFRLGAANAAAVLELCRRLQGMPLAIELAAARTRALPVELILAQLADPLPLLTRGPPGVPERQRSLRAAIAWSHALLTETEKQLFARLAVFRGGWTREAAAAICAGGLVRAEDIPDLLYSLTDKSLAVADLHEGALRMRYLETIRHFALEQLESSGAQAATAERHALHFRDLAERAEPELTGAEQRAWLRRLHEEQANLWVALAWCERHEALEDGLRMGGALWRFWYMHGDLVEGRDRLERLLLAVEGSTAALVDSAILAKALHAAGTLATSQADYAEAEAWLSAALRIREALEDTLGTAATSNNLGNLAYLRGDYDRAAVWYRDSLSSARAIGNLRMTTALLSNLADLAFIQSDYTEARSLQEACLQVAAELGDRSTIAACHHRLGSLDHMSHNFASAEVQYREALGLSIDLGDLPNEAQVLDNMGRLAHDRGDLDAARAAFEASLQRYRQTGDQWGACLVLVNLGMTELDLGAFEAAAERFQESMVAARRAENRFAEADALHGLGLIALRQGDLRLARQRMIEAMDLGRGVAARNILARWLDGFIELALAEENRECALVLDVACRALRQSLGIARMAGRIEGLLAEAWSTVPLAERCFLERRGASLTLDEALDLASEWPSSAAIAV